MEFKIINIHALRYLDTLQNPELSKFFRLLRSTRNKIFIDVYLKYEVLKLEENTQIEMMKERKEERKRGKGREKY